MRKRKLKQALAAVLVLFMTINYAGGYLGRSPSVSYADTATVTATSLNVRSGPGTTNQAVGKLTYGSSVNVVGRTTGSDGKVWYQIQFTKNGAQATGYVRSDYIKFPTTYQSDGNFEQYLSNQGFPESYKQGLRQLHAEYPNWVFTAQHTNLDWNDVINNESVVGRNLVPGTSPTSWKSMETGAYNWETNTWPSFDSGNWVAASREIVSYYMDPRNFFDGKYIFQFLRHKYNSNIHTIDGINSMVQGTFLDNNASVSGTLSSGGSAPQSGGNSNVSLQAPGASVSRRETLRVTTAIGPGMTAGPNGSSPYGSTGSSASYAEIIMNAAARSGVNPYVLTAMILQEQGSQGSRGVSGTVAGYEGYYNFFNIEAYKSGSLEAIERGLWFASQSGSYERPWNSVDKAILGGAMYYGANYVDAGQDTFYLKKFNVQGTNLYKHQYMTNVQAAASEGAKLEEAYSAQLKQLALEFKIPVYKNMPDSPCPQPTSNGSANNKLSGLSIDGYSLTPTFSRDITSYNVIVGSGVSSLNVRATALDSTASVTGTGTVTLPEGNTDITIQVKAQNGTVSYYVIHVVRQNSSQSGGTTGPAAGGTSASGSGQTSDLGVSIHIITDGPEHSSNGSGGSGGPGGSNVTIIR